jgi:dihydroorotate dehydrogenase (fumarate)
MAIDLSTRYLGLTLRNPVVVSSCPLTGEIDVLRHLERVGAAAAVLPSLFEEQIEHKEVGVHPSESLTSTYIESLSFYRELKTYNRGPDVYLKHVEQAKKQTSIPIIASLNGTTDGKWLDFARKLQDAGADALELNIYLIVTDPDITAQQIESHYLRVVSRVRQVVTIPLAVKLVPYFTAFANIATQLVDAGANGLVLFNRFIQPDINLDKLSLTPHLELSTADELHLPLKWIGLLRGRIKASLAATSGIHFPDQAIKALLVGADVTMLASVLYQHGVDHLTTFIESIRYWLENRSFRSVEQIQGLLCEKSCPDSLGFARANYTKAISSFGNFE